VLIAILSLRHRRGGAYPNITRALHNWLPFSERGLGKARVDVGPPYGRTNTLLWVSSSCSVVDVAFCVLGIRGDRLGLVRFFCPLVPQSAEEKPEVNAAEHELINAGRADLGAGMPTSRGKTFLQPEPLTLCMMYSARLRVVL